MSLTYYNWQTYNQMRELFLCWNCPNLKKVVIPSGTEVFGEDTFNGSENVVIYAPSGSGAEEFAKEKGISFQEYDSLDK